MTVLYPDPDELDQFLSGLSLPEPPDDVMDEYDPDDGHDYATLSLSRFKLPNIPFPGLYRLADAQAYCSRDDTRDPDGDWFVMFYRR